MCPFGFRIHQRRPAVPAKGRLAPTPLLGARGQHGARMRSSAVLPPAAGAVPGGPPSTPGSRASPLTRVKNE